MPPPRVRLTSDGYVKVKIRGKKRQFCKVPFLDEYRKRAFRNLRCVLKQLDFKVLGEELVKRRLDVEFNGKTIKVEVKDTVLLTIFTPTPELVRDFPTLNKPSYTLTFTYDGKGRFKMTFGYDEGAEYEAFDRFFRETFDPLYTAAFEEDAALKKEKKLERSDRQVVPDIAEIQEAKGLKPPATEMRTQAEKHAPPPKSPINPQIEPSIEDVKARISNYNPTSFRERLALERYREALGASPDKEEEINKVFYRVINGENDFKDFYRQLYRLAPKLIQRLELL